MQMPSVNITNAPSGPQGAQGIPGVPGSLGIQGVVAAYMNTTAMVILAALYTWQTTVSIPLREARWTQEMRQYRTEFDADLAKLTLRDDARMTKLWERHTELSKAIGELTTELKRRGKDKSNE